MSNNSILTNKQKDFILKNYKKMNVQDFAKLFNTTDYNIRSFANRHGITKYNYYIDVGNEIKSIPNYSKYLVDSCGIIFRKRDNMVLSQLINKDGYLTVKLVNDFGKRKTLRAHRIVAYAFYGWKDANFQVNHKDGNKQNNNYLNLEWVTPSQNEYHAYKTGLRKPLVGNLNNRAKCTNSEINLICSLIEHGLSNGEIVEELNNKINKNYVGLIRHHRRWKHISKNYNF